jgi:hypothetical protein
MPLDYFWRKKRKTPESRRSSKRRDWNSMGKHSFRRRHSIFAAEQVHFMPQIAQAFGRAQEIQFSSSGKIQTFVDKRDFHVTTKTSQANGLIASLFGPDWSDNIDGATAPKYLSSNISDQSGFNS